MQEKKKKKKKKKENRQIKKKMNEKTPDLPLFEYWICWRLMSFPRQTQLSFQLNGISRLVCMQQLFSNMYLATTRYAALKKPAPYVAYLQCRDTQTK